MSLQDVLNVLAEIITQQHLLANDVDFRVRAHDQIMQLCPQLDNLLDEYNTGHQTILNQISANLAIIPAYYLGETELPESIELIRRRITNVLSNDGFYNDQLNDFLSQNSFN